MPFTTSKGVRIRFDEHSQRGDALIFVHGYMGASEDWQSQVAEFSKDFRVITFDHRGHGGSDAPESESDYGVGQLIQDTLCIVAHLNVDRYHLVGHSIGGGVVQEIANETPEKILSLILCDTTDWFGDHDQPGGTPPYAPPETATIGAQRAKTMSQAALKGTWQGLLEWRGSSSYAGRIQARTLIVVGERDASRIVEGSKRLNNTIKNAMLKFIPNAGHSPHRESPILFNDEIRKFLMTPK